jgi:hypothetical protein
VQKWATYSIFSWTVLPLALLLSIRPFDARRRLWREQQRSCSPPRALTQSSACDSPRHSVGFSDLLLTTSASRLGYPVILLPDR